MNEGPMSIWIRNALLLGALLAGGMVTQLVPSYHAPEHSVTYRSKPASVSKANNGTSDGVSGVDVNLRHLALIGSIS